MTRPARALELPSWSVWRAGSLSDLLTIGIEEEFMLLDPHDWSLAYRSGDVMSCLPYDLRARVTLETHAAVMEIATGVHRTVSGAVAELAGLRRRIARAVAARGGEDNRCEEMLGVPCRTMAYPTGDFDDRVERAVAVAGYEAAAALPRSFSEPRPLAWPRVSIQRRDGDLMFRVKVAPLVRALRRTRVWPVLDELRLRASRGRRAQPTTPS